VARQAKDEINAAAIAERLDNPGIGLPFKNFRWDTGNLNLYYTYTDYLLSKIVHNVKCESTHGSCDNVLHCTDIEIRYSEL